MRTLKPGFFTNDQLGELAPVVRLLFQGLWCLADREGRLEDRPKRIKAEVLPYDSINIDKAIDSLAERGFIERYEVDGHQFIQVTNFAKHQNPHVREPASTIPPPVEHGAGPVPDPPTPNGHTSGVAPGEHGASTGPAVSARVPGHESWGVSHESWGVSHGGHASAEPAAPSGAAPRGNPRVAATIDTFREVGIEPLLTGRDRAAIKASNVPPGLIAATYQAVATREFGDGFMRQRLSVHEAIDWAGAYVERCLDEAYQRGDAQFESEKTRLRELGWTEPISAQRGA
jgi:hypothetical protein